jgi:hypothetical protein
MSGGLLDGLSDIVAAMNDPGCSYDEPQEIFPPINGWDEDFVADIAAMGLLCIPEDPFTVH